MSKQMDRPFELALTFDDILLIPQFSEIVPTDITPRSFFAKNIYLNAPIISAAMDTVTENKIARIMAQNGGFGIVHKNLTVAEQAFEVEKVKKYESGMIQDPITLSPDHYVSEALQMMAKYSISGIPVTVQGKLVGILTNRDLRFETNFNQPIKNLMTKEKLVTAPEGISLNEAKAILQKHRIEKLPVVGSDGKLKGLITTKDIEKSVAYPLSTKDSQGRLICGAAIGVGENSYERASAIVESPGWSGPSLATAGNRQASPGSRSLPPPRNKSLLRRHARGIPLETRRGKTRRRG